MPGLGFYSPVRSVPIFYLNNFLSKLTKPSDIKISPKTRLTPHNKDTHDLNVTRPRRKTENTNPIISENPVEEIWR